MRNKGFTVTRAEARELRRRSEELDHHGGGIPHEVVRAKWLNRLEQELREMVRTYDGTARDAKRVLECLLVAEREGVKNLARLRRALALKVEKKRAA